MTLSEVMMRGDGRSGNSTSQFYITAQQRCIQMIVTALQLAGESITVANIHRFLMTAARTPTELRVQKWRQQYHAQVMDKAFKAAKTPNQALDFQLVFDFWAREWPGLMDKDTRGNILATVQNVLSLLNTGMVREMIAGDTNCSPMDVLNGKWMLVNFPPSTYGDAGKLISTGWKQLVQQAILARKATEKSPFCVIWCDEAHQVVTSGATGDSSFIAQCRSHKGALIFLTQSVASFYAAMKGEAGRHQADALLANFLALDRAC
jgi:hypothetical protein